MKYLTFNLKYYIFSYSNKVNRCQEKPGHKIIEKFIWLYWLCRVNGQFDFAFICFVRYRNYVQKHKHKKKKKIKRANFDFS